MAKKLPLISEQLRQAIINADVTRYRISQETGIAESVLSRFVSGRSGISLDSIDKIASYLGIQLTVQSKGKRKT